MPYRNYNSSSKESFPWLAQVKVTGPDGRLVQRRHQCKTKKEALRWEAETRRKIESELEALETIRTVSLHEWATAYLDFARDMFVAKTYEEKRLAFRELFMSSSAEISCSDFNGKMALDCLKNSAKESGGNAANKRRKNLRAAWQWGVRFLSLPRENPFECVPRFAEQRQQRRVPTLEEFWKVYEAARDGQDKLMLFMYLQTGARRDELFRLQWKDVDLDGLRVQLHSRKNAVGAWEGKWLAISDELSGMLRAQKRITGFMRFVFLDQSDRDQKKWCQFQFRQHWLLKLCKRAGVEPFGIHGIRHLTASILADAGKPLVAIQERLRHHSVITTAKYIHSLGKENREVLDALPGIGKSALKAPCQSPGPSRKTVND